MTNPHNFIIPNWPAPKNIRALVTTRQGGVSLLPYASFNLATHVSDEPKAVRANRQALMTSCEISSIAWIEQVHGISCVLAETVKANTEADAVYTRQKKLGCAVLTADCLPIFFSNTQGNFVAVVHAGWRGLAQGIIENALRVFAEPLQNLLVWIGPAITQNYFEVGSEVVEEFLKRYNLSTSERLTIFKENPMRAGFYFFDFIFLAKWILRQNNVTQVFGGEYCTFANPAEFYSYRRDGVTGRQASVIWIDSL